MIRLKMQWLSMDARWFVRPSWLVAPEDLSKRCDLLVTSLRQSCVPIGPSLSSSIEGSATIFSRRTFRSSVWLLTWIVSLMVSTYFTQWSNITVHYALCNMYKSMYDGTVGTFDGIVISYIRSRRSTSLIITRSYLLSKHVLGTYMFTNVSEHVFKICMCLICT